MDYRIIRNRFAAAAAATALFAAVYELFSHRVYSGYMIFAFLLPLLGGALPYSLLQRLPGRLRPDPAVCCLYNSGLAALTAGSVFRGMLEIYGTTSRLSAVYAVAGAVLLVGSAVGYLVRAAIRKSF